MRTGHGIVRAETAQMLLDLVQHLVGPRVLEVSRLVRFARIPKAENALSGLALQRKLSFFLFDLWLEAGRG